MTRSVVIVSVGPGDPSLLNEKTRDTLLHADRLILRTGRHPLSGWLKSLEISYETMDCLYETSDDFDCLFSALADLLWKHTLSSGQVVYAVPDAMTDRSVDALFSNRPDDGKIIIIPGFSYADYYLSACRGFFSTSDIRICTSVDFSEMEYNPCIPVLITELNDGITAGKIKNDLSTLLNDEDHVLFFEKDAVPRSIPLYELDRQPIYSHMSAVAAGGRSYMQRDTKTFGDLIRIMDILRSSDGCSWDRAQSHQSLMPYLIEEAWETVDCIDTEDPFHLAEELGDLLFQIVFHSSIGKDYDEFTITDIITGISNKMIRRHPHVFQKNGTGPDEMSPEEWDRIKQSESGSKTLGASLDNISTALPSLRYAEKVIRKLQRVASLRRTEKEVRSSVMTLGNALCAADRKETEEKLGNLLFCCAELSQMLSIDCEVLLHRTVKRAVRSFQSLEGKEKKAAETPEGLTFKDLGVY